MLHQPLSPSEADHLRERVRRLEALARVQSRLAEAELDLDEFMQLVIDELEQLVGAAGVVLELAEGEHMVYRAVNSALAGFKGLRIGRRGSLSGLCVDQGEMLLCGDTADDPRVDRAACERTGIRSMICAPLVQRSRTVGVLKISSDRPHAFGEDDVHALRLITAALAAEMHKQVRFDGAKRTLAERTETSRTLAREVTERTALETELRAKEQRLAGIIGNAHQAIVTMTGDGLVTSWNRQAELTFGWSEDEALGQDMADLIVPMEMRDMHSAALRRFLETGEGRLIGRRIEVQALHKSGREIPVELAITAAAIGDAWEFTALLHDITERRSSTELFENAFNHAPIGMALVGLDGALLKVNDAFCRIIGYSPEEAQQLDFQSITHPEDLARDVAELERLLAGEGRSYRVAKRYIRKSGGAVWVRLSVSVVDSDEGQPKHFIAQVEDLTAEREAESRYRLMAENSTDMIATSDLAGVLTFVSPACERILGVAPQALIGCTAAELIHPDDIAGFKDAFRSLLKTGVTSRVRWRALGARGEWVWLESSPALLLDAQHEGVTGFIDVIRDVTDRKRREDALAEARARAEEAVKSKSDFVANVSHELRTPLNSIIGFSRLLTEAPELSDETKRRVSLIHSAGQALRGVIDNVLDFSKLEAEALELNQADFDLHDLIGQTIGLMEPQAVAKDLSLNVLLASDLPVYVRGDEGRLRQVLLNLLSNAVKFTREGAVTLSASVTARSEHKARLRIEVKDTGAGIPADRLDTLFGRFVQAGPSVASHYGGTGLGLAITRQLIELMGGAIGVRSVPDRGSTFFLEIELPLAVSAGRDQAGRSSLGPDSLHGRRILVVDDVDLNRDLMLATLSRYGAAIAAVGDGEQAVAAILGGDFDLVLMDCQMPVLDGFAATRQIRASGAPQARIPIVALTASAQPSHIDRCRSAGMDDHLTKPLDEAALERVLRRYLATGHAAAPGAAAPPPAPTDTALPPALEARYAARKAAALETIVAVIATGGLTERAIAEIKTIAHQLAGTAGMFGDAPLGEAAHALEIGLESWPAADRFERVCAAYWRLKELAGPAD
ncbi:PAS domain S-box protein [Sphingomonas parva]|nr:PAS domain S-box protein [Sphingomonas parva]